LGSLATVNFVMAVLPQKSSAIFSLLFHQTFSLDMQTIV